MDESEWNFISKDLPSFSSPTETFFVFNPDAQKVWADAWKRVRIGIDCWNIADCCYFFLDSGYPMPVRWAWSHGCNSLWRRAKHDCHGDGCKTLHLEPAKAMSKAWNCTFKGQCHVSTFHDQFWAHQLDGRSWHAKRRKGVVGGVGWSHVPRNGSESRRSIVHSFSLVPLHFKFAKECPVQRSKWSGQGRWCIFWGFRGCFQVLRSRNLGLFSNDHILNSRHAVLGASFTFVNFGLSSLPLASFVCLTCCDRVTVTWRREHCLLMKISHE